MRAYAFLLESTLALLASVLILLAIPLQPHATHKELYSYQVLGDFIRLAQNSYYEDVNAFANGDAASKRKLEAAYGKIISQMGDYCFKLEAMRTGLEVNCKDREKGRNTLAESVTFYDGDEFYEAKFALDV